MTKDVFNYSIFEALNKYSCFIKSAMSLIKSRLDISNLLSTKKNPWRKSAGDFYLLSSLQEDREERSKVN
jgi:hypothetical protein